MVVKKRANSEGSIYYLQDRKLWRAQVTLDGRRLSKNLKISPGMSEWLKETNVNCKSYH